MDHFKFFIYQVIFSIIGLANNILFREFINEFFNNKFITALIEVPIDLITLYFTFKIYFIFKSKLRYKILVHIGAFIVAALTVGLMGSFMGL
ncbi:hypothetical protein ASG81_07730 [Paenibacillus sp. Soil522]|nr:hypothetical protein ASG81_07730 [Paenibacillus sp. Soil522]